jgi:DNA-binding CsgD family transcriptional regulator
MRETAAAARRGPSGPQPPRVVDMLLDALALRYTDGYAAAAPMLVRAIEAILATGVNSDDAQRWLPLARSKVTAVLAADVWDAESWHALALGLTHFARLTGAPVYLQFALNYLAWTYVLRGELGMAALMIEEERLIADVSDNPPLGFLEMLLAAWRGQQQKATAMIEATLAAATAGGLRKIADFAVYAGSVLDNSLGRHESACVAAQQVFASDHVGLAALVIPELTEAASRTGDSELLRRAADYVSEQAQVVATPWALGIQARLRAMLAVGEDADAFHRESLDYLARTHVGVEVARGHLLYGEWLRRENRRVDARGALRAAEQMFTAMGASGFAERARRELRASGETARKRIDETREDLTPQELQVARLARDGFSNAEIGTRLFISARTVQYHLRKVFAKLGIRSRVELTHALPADNLSIGPSG